MSAAEPSGSDFRAAFVRSFTIQGSFNYRTLIGGGLAFAMLPLLKRIHAGDPVALRASLERHASSFNGHPYLCPMAVTALARLEWDGVAAEKIERFRTALRGPLGALGDRAVWAGWRPFCLMLAVAAYGLGAGALLSAGLFLLLYNAGHLALRGWAFRKGWHEGLEVGSALSRSGLRVAGDRLIAADPLLVGLAAVLLLLRTPGVEALGPEGAALAAAAAAAGFLAPRAGTLGVVGLVLAAALWPW